MIIFPKPNPLFHANAFGQRGIRSDNAQGLVKEQTGKIQLCENSGKREKECEERRQNMGKRLGDRGLV